MGEKGWKTFKLWNAPIRTPVDRAGDRNEEIKAKEEKTKVIEEKAAVSQAKLVALAKERAEERERNAIGRKRLKSFMHGSVSASHVSFRKSTFKASGSLQDS